MPCKCTILPYLATILFVCTGCSGESGVSGDILTAVMRPEMLITAPADDSSEISVRLLIGTGSFSFPINLASDESLTATLNSTDSNTLTRDFSDFSQPVYTTNFVGTPSGLAGSAYKISLIRPAGKVSAPDSDVTIPDPITKLARQPSSSFSREFESLTITWDRVTSTASLGLAITGNCIIPVTIDITSDDASGIYILPADSLSGSGDCPLTLALTRTANGTLDAAFAGGYIRAQKSASVTVASIP